MPSTFFLAPNPVWYFHDDTGRPAVGGTIDMYSSLDRVTRKPVYSIPSANPTFEYPNPIILDGSGGTPSPIYWEENGIDRYYIVVKDADGNIISTVDDFPIVGSGGGATPVENNVDVENHIVNGQFHFIRNEIFGGIPNIGTTILEPIFPVPEGYTYIAPGGGSTKSIDSSGLYSDGSNVTTGNKISDADVTTGWSFHKVSPGGLTDTIKFVDTTPGDVPPAGPGSNSPRYFSYESTNAIAATTLDVVYTIGDVRTFSGQDIRISFDAKCTGASVATEFKVEQYFGTGGGESAVVPGTPEAFTFPNGVWDRVSLTYSVPSVAGKTIGANKDDAIRLRWSIPKNTTEEFMIDNLQAVIVPASGAIINDFIFEDYNKTASKILAELIYGHLPKTGDSKLSIDPNPSQGWVVFKNPGETLGNAASGATWPGEATRKLYRLIWNSFTDANAPVSAGRGTSADDDFDANKTIQFPGYVGRVIAPVNVGVTSVELKRGADDHVLTTNQMPAHSHDYVYKESNFVVANESAGTTSVFRSPQTVINTTTSIVGNNESFSLYQPTAYMFLHVKL
jgi:hypothetical protein